MKRSFKDRFISLFLVFQMIFMFMPGIGQAGTVFTQSATTVFVFPSEVHNDPVGSTFSVDVNIADVADMYGYQADITYDSTVLQALSVAQGSFISGNLYSNGNMATPGVISGIYNALTASEPKNGSGTLFTVSFKVLKKGTSAISLENVLISDSLAQPIIIDTNDGFFENIAPAAPQNVTVESGDKKLTVSWGANTESDKAGYEVSWGSSIPYTASANVSSSTTSYEIDNLTNDATYHVAVRAFDTAGNYSDYSADKTGIPNVPPTAIIDSILPNPAMEGSNVTFTGHGTDNGSIAELKWKDGSAEIGATSPLVLNNLTIGEHTISFLVKDNRGAWSVADTEVLVIYPRPSAPVITNPDHDYTTKNLTVDISGTADLGNTISLYKNNVLMNGVSATVSGTGTWALSSVSLSEGLNEFYTIATDSHDATSSASNKVRVTKDTTPPTPPTFSSPAPGSYNADSLTFTGEAEAGSTVTLTDGATALAPVTAGVDGTWTKTVTGLIEGQHVFMATAADGVGNVSEPSAEGVEIFIDKTLPVVTIENPVNNSDLNTAVVTANGNCDTVGAVVTVYIDNSKQGEVTVGAGKTWSLLLDAMTDGTHSIRAEARDAANNIGTNTISVTIDTNPPAIPSITSPAQNSYKNDRSIIITGAAEANSIVTVLLGLATNDPVQADSSGNWTCTITTPSDGTFDIYAKAKDKAGNESGLTNARRINVDTVAPSKPLITSPADGAQKNQTSVDVSGTCAIDVASIQLYEVNIIPIPINGANTIPVSGNWTISLHGLFDGAHQIVARATDLAGNPSLDSIPVNFTVDTGPPAAPVISEPGDGFLINDSTPAISGTAESGATVYINVDGSEQTVTTTGNNWTITWTALADGTHTLKAKAVDIAANPSPYTADRHFTIDTVKPITSWQLNPASANGFNDWYISSPKVQLSRSETGVTYYQWDTTEGAWMTYSGEFDVNNGHKLYFYTVDSAGNAETIKDKTFTLQIDTIKPVSYISEPTDTVRSKVETPVEIRSIASDSEGGSGVMNVEISFDNGLSWIPMQDNDTYWSYLWTPPQDGVYNVKTKTTDTAGNIELPGTGITMTIDMTPPVAPTITTPKAGDYINNRMIAIKGTGDPGNTGRICTIDGDNHVQIATYTVNTSGQWEASATLTNDGNYTIGSRQTDTAGNESDPSTFINFAVDTDKPNAPAITSPADGVLLKTNAVSISGTFGDDAENGLITIALLLDNNEYARTTVTDGIWAVNMQPLTDGSHIVKAMAIDKAGNTSDWDNDGIDTVDFKVDTVCYLSVSEPLDGYYTNQAAALVAGTAEAKAVVQVNGAAVEVDGEGKFSSNVDLIEGENVITVHATDEATNEASKIINVYYDKTAPEKVTDLTAGAPSSSQIPLNWTVPNDNSGKLGKYDLRYSTLPIKDDIDFSNASKASAPAPGTSGVSQSHDLGGLLPTTGYDIAMKVMDKAGNWSEMSNVIHATTNAVPSGGGGGGGGSSASTSSSSETGSLDGRVMNTGGLAIFGATISDGESSATSNPDGSFAMTLAAGGRLVTYSAPGYESQTQWLQINPGQATHAPTCILNGAGIAIAQSGLGEIFGRVVDSRDMPIAGTAVRIDNTVIPTNSAGYFRFTLVQPGVYTVYYDAPGFIGQTQVIPVKAGETTNCPKVILSRSANGAITGTVVNKRNQPLAGVVVRIDRTVVPTNKLGQFRFDFVVPGRYTIHYSAVGYKSQTQVVDVANGVTTTPPKVILSK